jgi:glutamate carboxypeptidase
MTLSGCARTLCVEYGGGLAIEGVISRTFSNPASPGPVHPCQQAANNNGLPPPEALRLGGASEGNLTAALRTPTLDGLGAVGAHLHARTEHIDTNHQVRWPPSR